MSGEKGSIRIMIESKSYFLSSNLPYTVRDSHLALVASGKAGQPSGPLEPGVYSVSVVTPSGEAYKSIVQVEPGPEPTDVTLSDDVPDDVRGDEATWSPPPLEGLGGDAAPVDLPAPDDEGPAGAELLTSQRCILEEVDDEGWRFAPVDGLDAIPTATFQVGDQQWELSLPVNPFGTEPALRACRVKVVTEAGRHKVEMRFGPKRRVTRMIDGLLRNNELAVASEVLAEATDLLVAKYSDPTGAALGGLTLHRFGVLGERKGWVENLARDFAWLPDGRVLLAALLQGDPDEAERQRGLELLLAASAMRPLYTDGLSLAMELLRRWPDDRSEPERMQRLDHLADLSAYADWSAVNLTVEVTDRR